METVNIKRGNIMLRFNIGTRGKKGGRGKGVINREFLLNTLYGSRL